ncbi:hypothetical protein [Pararhizobium capsulatum]|uniref:hypothetical protein n=1 Tax=Pararhizobium capsulatum TaxID=34014 RepID=UPI0035214F7A
MLTGKWLVLRHRRESSSQNDTAQRHRADKRSSYRTVASQPDFRFHQLHHFFLHTRLGQRALSRSRTVDRCPSSPLVERIAGIGPFWPPQFTPPVIRIQTENFDKFCRKRLAKLHVAFGAETNPIQGIN